MERWETEGNPWGPVRQITRVFENPWFAVEVHDVINPAGNLNAYGVIRMPRLAVGVLPIDEEGFVHLVGQWRFPCARYCWEAPSGGAEGDEAGPVCARRELAEESGLAAAALQEILRLELSKSVTDERAVIYLATGLSPARPIPADETEVLRRRRAPFLDVIARIGTGEISDAMTIAGALKAHHMAVTGALPDALARAMLAR